jgi:hypothetical protein
LAKTSRNLHTDRTSATRRRREGTLPKGREKRSVIDTPVIKKSPVFGTQKNLGQRFWYFRKWHPIKRPFVKAMPDAAQGITALIEQNKIGTLNTVLRGLERLGREWSTGLLKTNQDRAKQKAKN